MKKILTIACCGVVAASFINGLAGNIPQYKLVQSVVSQGESAAEKSFRYLEGGTEVFSSWDGDNIIFGNGVETRDGMTGVGFPIGFDFRFGGQVFTTFAIDNCGLLFLGDENGVEFRGRNEGNFQKSLEAMRHTDGSFYTGVYYKAVERDNADYKGGQIFYKTEGEPGSRKLTVEYRNIRQSGQKDDRYIGLFDLQVILNENGVVDCIINELSSPGDKMCYFVPGMRGFDYTDQLILTSQSLGKPAVIAESRWFELLNSKSKVVWDGMDDYDHYYLAKYSFVPESDMAAPEKTPEELDVTQVGRDLKISCKRAADADATIILVSENPIEGESMPVDGLTYGVTNPRGEYTYKVGDATVAYYGDDAEPAVTFPNIKNGVAYYVAAISCNGYPAYNTAGANIVNTSTAQAAPSSLSAEPVDTENINLKWEAEDPVIITATLECDRSVSANYVGKFGVPEPTVNIGDEVPGGGTVVYVGELSEFPIKALAANKMHYFAAWTVRNGRMSSVYAMAHGTTVPSLPYEPAFETYPGWTTPEAIESAQAEPGRIGIVNRGNSREPAFRIYLVNEETLYFSLPEIKYEANNDLNLDFEFALETDRGFQSVGDGESSGGPSVQLPLGNEAGHFDDGALEILCNDNVVKTIKEYNGTMEQSGEDGWVTGSSTFEPVKVVLPMSADNSYKVAMRGMTTKTSTMYLRNIKIYDGSSHVGEIKAAENGVTVIALPGVVQVVAQRDAEVIVNSLDGRIVARCDIKAGESRELKLQEGIYIINGQKFLVR